MKNKFFSFQTVLQFLFILVAFVFVAVISTGFAFEWERILSWAFVALVALRLVFTLITYNMVFFIDNINRRRIEDSKYFVTLATNKLRVDVIYKESRFDELEQAIKDENHDEFKKVANRIIRKVSSRLSYDNINWDNPDIKSLADKYKLSEKAIKKLEKAIQKILDGKVKYEILEMDDILVDKDESRDKPASKKFNFRKFLLLQNLIKAGTFLVASIILTIITFTGDVSNFWIELVKNATILLGGIVSAIMLSYTYIKIRTSVFEERNKFLMRRMGIDVVYGSNTKNNDNEVQK